MSESTNENESQVKDVEVLRSTETMQITIPDSLPIHEAVEWLRRKEAEEEEFVGVSETILAYPMDGALALSKAIQQIYGWSKHMGSRTWWGGREKPQLVSVQTSLTEFDKVPWGAFVIPCVTGELSTNISEINQQPVLVIEGDIMRRDVPKVKELVALARKIVASESIYKGQAVRIEWEEKQTLFSRHTQIGEPQFIDLKGVSEDELIFTNDLMSQIRISLFTPIEKPDVCKAHGIPTKRGILLEGPYGTGKTMTAYVAAQKCVAHERTFIYIKDVSRLADALRFAQQYAPAMIFAEDVDRVMNGPRTEVVDKILNLIDGIESKNAEVMVVLTTNFVENINEAMYRPGRLDAIISVQPPNAEAVKRLILQYGRGLVDENTDLSDAARLLEGEIPAVIREAVERAKLAAISRTDDMDFMLTGEDLRIAAQSLRSQSDLLKKAQGEDEHISIQRARVLGTSMGEGMGRGLRAVALRQLETDHGSQS